MGYIYLACLLVSECECVSHVSESECAACECESDESTCVDALFCMPQSLCQLESERLTLVINI